MKNEVDEVNLNRNEMYETIIKDTNLMAMFLKESSDFEKILLYRYVLDASKKLKDSDESQKKSNLPLYWLASMELGETEGVKKYIKGEISSEAVEKYIEEKNVMLADPEHAKDDLLYRIFEQSEAKKQEQRALIDSIIQQLEQRKEEKHTFKYQLKRFFRG